MDYVELGRTGLKVSVAGLGCGGHSRLGTRTGHGAAHAEQIVGRALDLGITFFDTAQSYGTEAIIGRAVVRCRDRVVISTKTAIDNGRDTTGAMRVISPAELRRRVKKSLKALRTDYIDIFNLHGVTPEEYAPARIELVGILHDLRQEGKIRFPGLTEFFQGDMTHQTLDMACRDDFFDVVMTGFNMLNQTARKKVFPLTRANGTGTQVMFAVRKALTSAKTLQPLLDRLAAKGEIDHAHADAVALEAWLIKEGGARSLADAAYRFCRYEPGAHVVLTGTGNMAHLETNVRSLLSAPLEKLVTDRLKTLFANVRSVTGNE